MLKGAFSAMGNTYDYSSEPKATRLPISGQMKHVSDEESIILFKYIRRAVINMDSNTTHDNETLEETADPTDISYRFDEEDLIVILEAAKVALSFKDISNSLCDYLDLPVDFLNGLRAKLAVHCR
jgi:hypothetical protein